MLIFDTVKMNMQFRKYSFYLRDFHCGHGLSGVALLILGPAVFTDLHFFLLQRYVRLRC